MALKRTGPPKRKTRLKTESAKRRAQRRERAKVVEQTNRTYGVCAMMRHATKCHGRLETHELVGGSRRAQTYLDAKVTINLCSFHNGWVEANPSWAYRLGMKVKGWVYDKEPEKALKEAARLRGKLWMTKDFEGEDPYWFSDPYWLGTADA
jgi:hypothetical protein